MAITKSLFLQQCKRRFGNANPERMRSEYYEYMVRRREDPYVVRCELGLESNLAGCSPDGQCMSPEPDWCFDRFGMSRTHMPDGRIICIAGEHEDFYDPDFCIYNDVIVLRPPPGEEDVTLESGEVEIYGYPESLFPPTDFHSATLVNGTIFIIGRLGYMDTRQTGRTPVFVLDASTYRIEPIAVKGEPPGWIYEHYASYDLATHAITVRGGKIYIEQADDETSHYSAYRLHLEDMRWELITSREMHRRFVLTMDVMPEKWIELSATVFQPSRVPFTWLGVADRGVDVYSLDICGVRVTFEDFSSEVSMLVEGDLPQESIECVLTDVLENLSEATGVDWTAAEKSLDM